MKTEVKKIDVNKREINIEESGDIVANKFKDVFEKIGKEAKVPGFRPGHAPLDMLEKHYSAHAHEQVLKELIPELYSQAVGKEGLDVVEMPEISEVKLDRNAISFKAKVEVSPEIALPKYKGLKVNYKKVEVAADEIKRNIDSLKESRKADKIDDSFAKSVGYPDLQELEKMIQTQLFLNKENYEHQRMEQELVDSLVKDLEFKIPESMVKRQLEELLRQAKLDLALKGVQREQIDSHEKKMREELEPEARKQVRVYLVLSAIAKKEGIAIDEHMQHKVVEFLYKEADWNIISGGEK